VPTHPAPVPDLNTCLQEVARLAGALVDKWRVQGDGQLFSQLEYDAEAAAAAPEGDPEEFKLVAPPPPAPEEPPPEQPTRVQPPRKDRATRVKVGTLPEVGLLPACLVAWLAVGRRGLLRFACIGALVASVWLRCCCCCEAS
jgi:hypothetical protein